MAAENVIYKGNFDVVNMTIADLLSLSVNRYSSRNGTMNYNELSKVFLGSELIWAACVNTTA